MSEYIVAQAKVQPIRTNAAHGMLQRCSNGVECPECRARRLQNEGTLQRAAINAAPTPAIPPIVHNVLNSPGQPLSTNARAFMEPRFGHDFSHVRVHTDAQAAESARAVNALAYTVGRDVVFGTGQYMPETMTGKRLLAHELTHVVQQAIWDVGIGMQRQLEIGATDDIFEQEANKQAATVIGGGSETHSMPFSLQPTSGTIQRAAIHQGNILDEGGCTHLACNSRFACEDKNGITCPDGTRNASPTKKFRPLFTCDHDCNQNLSCDSRDTWMAIPHSRFAPQKCDQDLVICANHNFTHGYIRDRSDKEAWEVSPGIQDSLGVSGTFSGAIYPDESDQAFIKDTRCHGATSQAEPSDLDTGNTSPDVVAGDTTLMSEGTVADANNSTVTANTDSIDDENV